MSVLRFEDVTYHYPHATGPALRGVTVDIAAGEFVVAAGLSASGKSTFLRAACGLAPHFHGGEFAGRVVTGGLDTRAHGPAQISAVAGTLFQDPETQVVLSTVRAELALPLESRGHSAAAVARGVEETALALGIGELLERATHELSGGELQRVALGAALAGRPRLRPPRRAHVAAQPGRRRRARLAAAPPQRGVGNDDRARRAPARALPRRRRSRARVRGRRAGVRRPPRGFLEWAAERAPALATPGAPVRAGRVATPPSGVEGGARRCARTGLLAEDDGAGARAARRAEASGGSTPSGGAEERGCSAAPGGAEERGGSAAPGGAEERGGSAAPGGTEGRGGAQGKPRRGLLRRGAAGPAPALAFRGVWFERSGGRAVLRGVDLALAPGERVALMGRNGAGKSTLLRHANGLLAPTRGRVERAGRVALLLQNPNDYFLADRVGEEVNAEALEAAGLTALASRHPRDLSGGERQRLALAIVCAGSEPPAALCLDEPTRGMDRAAKGDLAADLRAAAQRGSAVLVATHDPEFAATCADRVVLLAGGRPIADGPAAELLSGGWYFATETARIVNGALLPEDGADVLRARMTIEVRP